MPGRFEVARLGEDLGCADEGADRERVPARQDLLVAPGLRAPLDARRAELRRASCEDRLDRLRRRA